MRYSCCRFLSLDKSIPAVYFRESKGVLKYRRIHRRIPAAASVPKTDGCQKIEDNQNKPGTNKWDVVAPWGKTAVR